VEESFERAQQLIRELKEHDTLNVIALVATKSDLLSEADSFCSIRENAAAFAAFHDISYWVGV
jgi:hypothetical protein